MRKSVATSVAGISSVMFWLLVATSTASACAMHAGMYSNFSLMGELVYQVEHLHSYLMVALANAEAAAKSGQFSQAAFLPLGIGFSYGALHALGPGHGKLVVAGYFAGRPAPAREALRMASEIATLHVGSAALIAIVAAVLLGGVIDASGTAFTVVKLVSYALIAVAGLAMIYRAVAIWLAADGINLPWPGGAQALGCGCGHAHDTTPNHNHDHNHDHAHAHHAHQTQASVNRERGLLSFAVGAVPCTGALIAVLFALASGAWLVGLLTVAAISIGMGVTLAAVGLLTIWTRGTVSPAASGTLTLISGLGGLVVLLVGAALFTGTASLI
ncbi:hypothetical protein [Pyruvatibacter sp.]|uniref:HoxN/HupN/NixA family nickel/cobalt transporter n=1 Tax=Pyruvatibacter sp. TaxID=1981328 RepID=UPI0032ED5D90